MSALASPIRSRWLLIAGFAALVLALYADPLFLRRSFGGRDLTAYNLGMEKSVHDAWARGRIPVWQAEVSGGRPLVPNPNAGALYPVRALLSPLPFPSAMRVYPVLHWMAAGIGVLVLAMSIGRSRSAAWIGAVTYAFSGVAVAEVFYPHIQPGMTLLPWIVWAIGRKSGSTTSRLLVLSALLAVDLLAADVFTVGVAIACGALWIALEEDASGQFRSLGRLAAALVLAALAAAPQAVATALWIPQTNRAIGGMKLSEVVLFSIHPWRLLELAVPYPFGPAWDMSVREMWGGPIFRGKAIGIFPTLYAGAFVPIAVCAAWRSRERGARFARVLLALALLASMAPSLLPAGWAGWASPLPLRNPEKLAVAFGFAASLMASFAFDGWRRLPRRLDGWIALGGLMAIAAALCARFPEAAGRLASSAIRGDPPLAAIAARHLPGALAEGGLLLMITVIALDRLGRADRRGSLAIALVGLTLVPLLANRKIARSFREEDVFAPTAFARYVARRDPEGSYRTLDESIFRPASGVEMEQYGAALSGAEFSRRTWVHLTPILFGRGTVFNEDFDAGDLSRVESLRRVSALAAGYRDSSALFGSVALRFGIRYRDQESIAGYAPVGGDALQVWDEHGLAYPDVRLLRRWEEVPGPVAAFRRIASLEDGEGIVEAESTRRGGARLGTVRMIRKDAEGFAVDLDAPDASWLFVLRAYWPYRSIRLDGKLVEGHPAQLAFSAVPIPPGRHRLEWEEEVPGLGISRWGPVAFVGIAIGIVVAQRRRRGA